MRHILLLAALLATPSALPGQTRLERTIERGTSRLCVYGGRPTAAQSIARAQPGQKLSVTGGETRVLQVGRGEPCPPSYRQVRQAPPAVPSLATLRGRTRDGSRVTCIYALAGRDYPVAASAGGYCPLTPSLLQIPPADAQPAP